MELMDKKIDDLTVGDSVKLTFGYLAVMAGAAVVIGAGAALYEEGSKKLRNRRYQKSLKNEEK